jgi:dihydroorotate dehydrogenase electron transfer subunit
MDIIGPLGKPFPFPHAGQNALLVAGGIGLGPILFFASALIGAGIPCTMVFGCRSKENLPASAAFSALQPLICTDDGSAGFRGTAIDYCHDALSGAVDGRTAVYACGPHAMLKGCHEFARARGAVCHVSVEQIMACGVGACMGCAVRVNHAPGFVRACMEGPVFDSREIAWE